MLPSLTPAPDALGAEVPPVFPIKVNFSENKYITQSIADEHPNVFALTFSTLYKKEVRELQANVLMSSDVVKFSEDTRFSISVEFRITQKT